MIIGQQIVQKEKELWYWIQLKLLYQQNLKSSLLFYTILSDT